MDVVRLVQALCRQKEKRKKEMYNQKRMFEKSLLEQVGLRLVYCF